MDFINLYFLWKPARISPKQKEEQAEDSSPDPSSSACDIRIQKKGISRSFAESFPQKIVSAKLRPHCFRFPRLDFLRKKFEFCPEHTARKRNRVRMQKYGRHEVPSVLNSPKKILNLKGFATQSVAQKVRFDL